MDEVERLAKEHRPKLLLAGWSAYPRVLDFPRFREIADEVGALLMVDMAHFAGLVAAGVHPNPVPYADVVTTTVHKTLGGPRSGLILCREEYAKKINSAVFPGQQGGPLEHAIAAKAVALKIAASDLFKERQERTVAGAQAVAEELLGTGNGVSVLTGGTDVHLVLVDLRDSELDGQQAEDRLHSVGITVNRNAVPFDPRPPMVTSGLRIGTPALATRGLQQDDFVEVGKLIARALQPDFESAKAELTERVTAIADRFPLYAHLGHARCRVAHTDLDRLTGRDAVSSIGQQQAAAQLTLLARVGAILGSGLARQETLERVAELLVPAFAGWCAIDLEGEDGELERRVALPKAFPPLPPDAPHGPAIVMRTGEPELVREITEDALFAASRGDWGRLAEMRALQLKSALCVPLSTGTRRDRDAVAAGDGAPLRQRGRRADDGDRAPLGGRDRVRPDPCADADAVRGVADADVGLRLRDAAVPRGQRRHRRALRLHARRVPRRDDHQGHPPAGGGRAAARRHQQPRRRRVARGQGVAPSAAATARRSTSRSPPGGSTSRATTPCSSWRTT